jgi:hypothetical protein
MLDATDSSERENCAWQSEGNTKVAITKARVNFDLALNKKGKNFISI